MDPITASLLTALGVAVTDKATGAAVRWLTEATKERARRLWGVIADTDEEKFAQRMVAEVMAEAAAFPPEKALVVHPLGTIGDVGIWRPGGELRLKLLWVNRADFPIHVRGMRVTTMLGEQQQWDAMLGDEFALEPRGLDERAVALSSRLALPSFERGGASCDVSVSALVCGPWDEGRAQRTRDLVTSAGIWVPTFGLEPVPTGLDDVEDIDVKRMCPQCACAVKVHLASGWKSRPRRKSTPSVAIWRGREVTLGLEAQRQKASKGGRASLQAAT
jgi:hypothetical protein